MNSRKIWLTVLALSVFGAVSVSAADWYVATDGNDSGPGTELNPFQTIQWAIDTTSSGDTINVAVGTYNEAINIPAGKDGLEIAGTNAIVDGTNLGDVNGFNYASNSVKIHGFTIQNFVSTVNMQGWGIITEAGTSGGELYDNTITSGSGGIYIHASTNYEVYDNNINNITGNWPLHGHGIIIYSSDNDTDGPISGNIIGKAGHPNSISNTTGTNPGSGQGIFVGSDNELDHLVNADGTKVEYNIISNVSTTKAIQVAGVTTTSTVDVKHNQIRGSKLCGLHIQYCGTINVNNNTFSGSTIWPNVIVTYDAAHTGNCLTGEEMYDIFKNNGNTFDTAAAAVTPAGSAIDESLVYSGWRCIWRNIQDAIDDAYSGYRVEVLAGTYNENLTVNKFLTLFGANANVNPVTDTRDAEAIINGGGTGDAVSILADSVTVNGFEVTNGTLGIVAGARSGLKISDNMIHHNVNPVDEQGCGITITESKASLLFLKRLVIVFILNMHVNNIHYYFVLDRNNKKFQITSIKFQINSTCPAEIEDRRRKFQ